VQTGSKIPMRNQDQIHKKKNRFPLQTSNKKSITSSPRFLQKGRSAVEGREPNRFQGRKRRKEEPRAIPNGKEATVSSKRILTSNAAGEDCFRGGN